MRDSKPLTVTVGGRTKNNRKIEEIMSWKRNIQKNGIGVAPGLVPSPGTRKPDYKIVAPAGCMAQLPVGSGPTASLSRQAEREKPHKSG